MTRLWVSGVLIEVALSAKGDVLRFVWEERVHPVQGIANRWRVDVGWWRLRV